MKNLYSRGIIFALGAALLNGTVGISSKGLFTDSLAPSSISFYKCAIAFIVLTIFAIFNSKMRDAIRKLNKKFLQVALCAFLGIFVLYFFETTAYKFEVVPFVVFVLLGTSTMATFILSTFILKEKKRITNYIGVIILIMGLCIMEFSNGISTNLSIGAILAAIAGIGYGLFLVLTKKFSLEGGLALIWYFMLFGTIYLFIPFYYQGVQIPEYTSMPSLLALAILPTIGGFYCTTRALTYLEANKVQLLELTEPLFAALFSYIILNEAINKQEWIGAILILIAIYISDYKPAFKKRKKKPFVKTN